MDTDRVRVLDSKKKSEVILDPLEDPEGKTLAIRIQLTESTYYLIENRQPRGFDKNLPGSGVLIMFGDDRVRECRKGKSPVKLINADPSQEHLAGAAFDLGKNPEFTDREHNLRIRIVSREGDSKVKQDSHKAVFLYHSFSIISYRLFERREEQRFYHFASIDEAWESGQKLRGVLNEEKCSVLRLLLP
jgi:hypothetical protein